ncbi:polysaccharide deacetylase family protein [Thalassotalea maritima]|uniref:polysaccharide deacetylase family protein n=1 Tax=Thalassotalea maritima TaxID=3242416 RepID=UPI003528C1D7
MSSPSDAKQIAITFDDAPLSGSHLMAGKEKTKLIINHLKDNKVSDALFFVTTGNIHTESDIHRLQAYTDAGFHLAHHSHNHISANKVDTQVYLDDFDTSHAMLQKYQGVLKFHRHPYLHYGQSVNKREAIATHLKRKGYQLGYVTVDNYDWYINAKLVNAQASGLQVDYEKLGQLYVDALWASIEFYDSLAQKHLKRSPKHVLLLHENEVAALYLDKLIQHIRAKGWEIISPQHAYTDPIAARYDAKSSTFNKQGRVASILHSSGVDTAELRHESENTDYIDQLFAQYHVFK